MLENIFTSVCNMGITASIAAVLIIILRFAAGRKLPKFFSYILWAVVLVRLLIPFSFSSVFSIFNALPSPAAVTLTQSTPGLGTIRYIPDNIGMMQTPGINTGSGALNDTINSSFPAATPKASVNPMQIIMLAATLVWITGAVFLLAFSIYLYLRALKKLNTSVLYRDSSMANELGYKLKLKRKVHIYTSTMIDTPVVCGLLQPRIILPLFLLQSGNERALQHIITHELVHIKRFDYITKPLWILALCLHWFNPVIWVSYILFQKDMEMSCDERVMLLCDSDIRSEYAALLIDMAAKQNSLLNGGLLAFGESSIKSRIKGIVSYKKPGFWVISAAAAGLLFLGVLLLTNNAPYKTQSKLEGTPLNTQEEPGKAENTVSWLVEAQNAGLYGTDRVLKENVYYTTAVLRETMGKQGPGSEYKDIVRLPYGRLVFISARQIVGEWLLASLTPEMHEDGHLIENTENSRKFWVSIFDVDLTTKGTISFDEWFPAMDVGEYRYMISGSASKDGKVYMRQTPDDNSPLAAIMREGNLVSVVRRDKDWSLVKKINAAAMEEATRVGWIRNEFYQEYKPDMKATQGFVLRSAKMYENPDTASKQYPAENLKSAILPVNIQKSQNGWTYISSGFNGLALWVRSEEVKYSLTTDELFTLAYPTVDRTKLLGTLKDDIRNWENIELRAEDTEKKVVLSSSQKSVLAEKLKEITDVELFDGGISLAREAYYPFYWLAFKQDAGVDIPYGDEYPEGVDIKLTIAGDDRLLFVVPFNIMERYGMKQNSIPVRFIQVNRDFIDYMKSLLPVEVCNNPEDFSYLLNAKKVIVKNGINISVGVYIDATGTTVQQVNKCARKIKSLAGKELEPSAVDRDLKEITTFRFVFFDGSQIDARLTRQYVQFGNRYYSIKDGVNPENILMSLFAGYF